MTLKVLKAKGQSNCAIARVLGVTEGAVRYRLSRIEEGAVDGRGNKPFLAEGYRSAIEEWVREHEAEQKAAGSDRPVNVRGLYEFLLESQHYAGSYKSVLRFVRARFPAPKIRPFRRIELPPGAQAQADWAEFSGVDIGDGPQTLQAFLMVLSHSRKRVVIWSQRRDQLSWHRVHNEAFRRLQGIPAVLRIDNTKTAVSRGAGPWGELNPAYQGYARAVGFHIDLCLPESPRHKGKVERKVGDFRTVDPRGRHFADLADLQRWTDEQLEASDRRRICPATGRTVQESWRQELPHLRPVGILPEVFDVVVTRPVHRDATVNFEGRTYSVPFVLVGLMVEVRGCAARVQILHDANVVAEHPRGTLQRLLIDPSHYEGPGNERVQSPMPLGRLGRRLQEIALQPVQQRPLDLYAALAEVAR